MKDKYVGIVRIIIGFTLALLITVLIGFSSYKALRQQTQDGEITRHTYQVINQLDGLENLVLQMATSRRGYRATQDQSNLVKFHEAETQINGYVEQVRQLVADNSRQVQRVNYLSEGVSGLLSFWKVLDRDNNYRFSKEGNNLVTNQESERILTIRNTLREMVLEERNLLQKRLADTEEASKFAIRQIILSSGVAILLVTLLTVAIVRELAIRRRAETELEDNLQRLEHLHEEAQGQNWLIAGSQRMAEGIMGQETVEEVAFQVLEVYVSYMRLAGGAFHIFNFPGRQDRSYVFGLDRLDASKNNRPHSLAVSVAHSGQARMVAEVPEKIWHIKSSFGEVSPGTLGFWPVIYDGKVMAVVELAVFDEFRPRKLAFIAQTLPTIATALFSARSHEMVNQLLEKVQNQSEELMTQQEELRQTNEELMRQAATLQSSEEELRVQQEELQQTNEELAVRNEAILKTQEALTTKARELEVTSRYKSEFLANMSHELRTPLNSVLILAKLLEDNNGQNLTEKQVEYAGVIHKSGTDLLNLINDILDLSKIEAGKVDFFFEQVSVASVVKDLFPAFEVVAAERGIRFETHIGTDVPAFLHSDKARLEQVLKNLLSNAFKFTPRGGLVELRVEKATGDAPSGSLAFQVRDTGIGIARDKWDLVFEAFRQADGSTSRKYGGTGLGLSISRELARNLGGSLRLESELGKGSVFTLLLPEAGPQQEVATMPFPEKKPNGAYPLQQEEVPRQEVLADDRNQLEAGKRLMLIIEDDLRFAAIVRDFARERGYQTLIAVRGDEGLFYARNHRPDAIILDMQLPVIDGWSLLKMFKEDEKLRHIPVHILSAADKSSLRVTGALGVANKPLEKEDLDSAFERITQHLADHVERVLIYGDNNLAESGVSRLLQQHALKLEADFASKLPDALQKLETNAYQCIIADISDCGLLCLPDLKKLKEQRAKLPFIVYLDAEISAEEETELRQISDVLIRESPRSRERLLDELELFHHRMQEVNQKDAPASVQADKVVLAGRRILLVDDDMRNVFALTHLLETQDVEIFTALDGQEALDKMNAHPDIELVLMDIMMPNMDGYEATRRLRADTRFAKLPIIALTAKAMIGDRERTLEAGASDYITKPVDGARLLSLLRVWLAG